MLRAGAVAGIRLGSHIQHGRRPYGRPAVSRRAKRSGPMRELQARSSHRQSSSPAQSSKHAGPGRKHGWRPASHVIHVSNARDRRASCQCMSNPNPQPVPTADISLAGRLLAVLLSWGRPASHSMCTAFLLHTVSLVDQFASCLIACQLLDLWCSHMARKILNFQRGKT